MLDITLTRLRRPRPMPPHEYDPELEDVRSILADLCAHLHDRRCLDFAVSIANVSLPVEVYIDLCVLMEQAPTVIRSLERGENCNLDFYEQDTETFSRFEFRNGICLLSGISYDRRINLDEAEVEPAPIAEMLRRVVRTFLESAIDASPTRVLHPWMREWAGDLAADAIRAAETREPAVFTKIDLVWAIMEFVATQRPLFAYAHANFSMGRDIVWTPTTGVADIEGKRWSFGKHGFGYRFENEEQVELDIDNMLQYTADSIDAYRLSWYLSSRLVGHVVLDRDEIEVGDLDRIQQALERLAKTGLLARASNATLPEYRLVPHVDFSRAVVLAQDMAREHFGKTLEPHAIEGVLRERLWGHREFWKCCEEDIGTKLEVANLLVARIESDLIRTRDYAGSVEWNDTMGAALVEELVRLLPGP